MTRTQRDSSQPSESDLSFAVVICCYTDKRWDRLIAAIDSVREQTHPAAEIVICVDHNEGLFDRVSALPGLVVTRNVEEPGLSGARNSGVAVATADILAFLDDDARADPSWLAWLADGYSAPHVVGVGGSVIPDWDGGRRPPAVPDEFDWVVGCSRADLPKRKSPVRNFVGANMSFRRSVLEGLGGFQSALGRTATTLLGAEETELCVRAAQSRSGAELLYEPRALVRHYVPPDRQTFRYLWSRCKAEGRSKAMLVGMVGARRGLSEERAYAFHTLPAGFFRRVGVGIRERNGSELLSALAIPVGLAATSTGYLAGRVEARRSRDGIDTTSTEITVSEQESRDRQPGGETAGDGESAWGPMAATQAEEWVEFNIHDRVRMRVAGSAGTANIFRDMFAPFLTREAPEDPESHQLVVTSQIDPIPDASLVEDKYRHDEHTVFMGEMGVQVSALNGHVTVSGTRELLTTVLPIVDALMVKEGAAMIHSMTVAYKGRGINMPAWGGVGKTSTIAKLLKMEEFAFLGDDWAFLDSEGELLGYAKPMFIKPHHRPIYPHLFESKKKPLVPSTLSSPISHLTTMVHPVITRYPRVSGFVRRWSPEHMMVRPSDALPDANMATRAPLALSMFTERHQGSKVELIERDADWMVTRLIGNFHSEMSRHSREVMTALAATGIMPIEEFFAAKTEILRAGVGDTPSLHLRVPAEWSADRASDEIVDQLMTAIEHTGIGQ